MAAVFISYARPDREKVSAIAGELEAAGHEVWWDRQVAGGEEFSAVIEEELNAAELVLVCWSAAGNASKWVRDEATVGGEQDKLVSLSLDGSMPPLGFRQYHCLDLAAAGGEKSDAPMAELLDSVAARLGKAPAGRSAQASPQPAADGGQKRILVAAALMVVLVVAAVAWRSVQHDAGGEAAVQQPPDPEAPSAQTAASVVSDAELAAVGTGSQQAFDLYQEARQLLNRRGLFLNGAIDNFGQAIELDPQFARAYAGLAAAHLVSSNYLRTPTALSHKRARSNAEKALELDPSLAEPWAVLGALEIEENQWQAGMDAYARALEQDPDNTTALQWQGESLMYLGYFGQSADTLARAIEIDPSSPILELIMGNVYWAMHDLESAYFHYGRSEKLGNPLAKLNRGMIDLERGKTLSAALDFAETLFELGFVTEAEVRPFAQFLLDVTNHTVNVDEEVGTFPAPASDSDFMIMLYIFGGEAERALKEIEADVDRDKDTFVKIWTDIEPAPRHHPYFKTFVRNTGMLDYWLTNGWPDVCRPLDEENFVCD